MKYIPRKNESGMALVFAIGLLALLLMIGLAFSGNSINYRKVAENNSARSQARMFALSAVSRAASSLMIFSHQYTKENDNGDPPKNLDHIFSFAKYGDDGAVSKDGKEFKDALLGEKSLMLLPGNYSVVNEIDCLSFNQKFKHQDKDSKHTWKGTWVFFTNGKTGSDRRIIGRAAWQVIGNSASIAAPVFMRGHLYLDKYNQDLDGDDPVFSPNNCRWGREIDEVCLDVEKINSFFDGVDEVVKNKAEDEIPSYTLLYATVKGDEDSKKQRWIETWFLPELNGKSVAEASPMPGKYEGYCDEDEVISRFNISELTDIDITDLKTGSVNWVENYDGLDSDSDPWYARFCSASDANSEKAIELLSRDVKDAIPSDKNRDHEVEVDKRASIPFLRFIGKDQGTFASLAEFRKQIAANFNDYCDKDGIPTSDIPADEWLEKIGTGDTETVNDKTVINHPLYTGNEKTPYLYEIGMNFGLISNTSEPQVTATKVKDGEFVIGLDVKAAPMIKLCNVYNFDPAEKIPMSSATMYNAFANGDFMRVYVDWDAFNLTFRLREAKLKDLEFSYVVTTVTETTTTDSEGNKTTETKTGDPETKTFKYGEVKLASLDDDTNGPKLLNSVLTFTGSEWKRAGAADADGSVKIQPMAFSADELKNSDGANPYPAKKSSSATDAFWQKTSPNADLAIDFTFNERTLFEDITSGEAPDLKPGVEFVKSSQSGNGTLDEYRKALGGVEEKTTSQNGNVTTVTKTSYSDPKLISPELTTFDVVKIKVESVSVRPRRVILTANDAVNDKVNDKEIGVDYVRALPEHKFENLDIELTLNSAPAGSEKNGIVLGSYRNYDPRQNLNAGDWLQVNRLAAVKNFVDPVLEDEDKERDVICLDGVNKYETQTDFSPKYDGADSKAMDWEVATEPAFTKDGHISTAVIRNAPMMSPWEIGFIHRAYKWQTINLKEVDTGTGDEYLGMHEKDWGINGTSYASGDAAILEQIKMTDRLKSYGKINVNRLRKGDPNFNDYPEANKAIIKALFRNIIYGEDPVNFIKNSQRNADGSFPDPEETDGEKVIDDSDKMLDDIVDNFLAGNRGQYSRRISFIEWSHNNLCLENGFHSGIAGVQTTDASQEEIIGKTINLLSAEYSSPNIVDLVVVAQSIRDVDGEQVKISAERTSSNFNEPVYGSVEFADLAEDGMVSKECSFGKFDMLEHKTDPDKNVYFDEITGEVKMFVRLHYDSSTGRMTILKMDYL